MIAPLVSWPRATCSASSSRLGLRLHRECPQDAFLMLLEMTQEQQAQEEAAQLPRS